MGGRPESSDAWETNAAESPSAVDSQRRRSRRGVLGFVIVLLAACSALLLAPTAASAVRPPRLPAAAGAPTDIATAAADALAALWGDDPSYGERLAVLVPLVAVAAKVAPEVLSQVWLSAPRKRMIVLLSALTQVGVPYRPRRATPGVGFDCSGLTSWAWRQVGKYLPHQSGRQIRTIAKSSKQRVLPGDIVYYPGHAMMAIGVGVAMVHSPYPGRSVEVSPPTGRWERIARIGTPDGLRAPLPA